MSDQCAAPECQNTAPMGKLCAACEQFWLKERVVVVDEAERLTDLAAQFARYCAEHGQPNPFTD